MLCIMICFVFIGKAQTPTPQYLTLSSTQVVPVDETKRAKDKITLTDGFLYGAGNAGSKLTLQISDYPSYVLPNYSPYNIANCTNNSHQTNPLVGEIEGNFAVTPNGSATYQIPIKMSPGTAGMQPNLSVVYASGSSSGVMGLGWSIAGLSVITRGNKNPYLDGNYGAVNMDLNDVYYIDGNRLIIKTGTYGTAGSTYDNEITTFADITASGSQGFGPQSFVVIDKNGTTTEYGNPAYNAQLTGVGDNTPLAWLINRVTDEFGNYMTFNYTQLNGETVISSIQYTGNTGLSPYNEIVFEYEPKTEKNTFYVGNKEFHTTQLLKSITAKSNSDLVKKYAFDYAFSFNTILNKITEINQDGSELVPTSFCWDDPNNNSISQYAATQSTQLYSNANDYQALTQTIPADINGDGFSDVVAVVGINQYQVLINNYPSNFSSTPTIAFNNIYTSSPFALMTNVLSSHVFDTDYDNKQEVYTIVGNSEITYQSGGNSGDIQIYDQTYKIHKLTNTSGVNVSTIFTKTLTNPIDFSAVPSKFYYDRSDYNGDGNIDELIIDPESVTLNCSSGNTSIALGGSNVITRPIDIDGDGSTEIVSFMDNMNSISFAIYKYSNGNFTSVYAGSIGFSPNTTYVDLLKLISLGDYNGDAKTDIAFLSLDKQTLSIIYSTGSSYTSPKVVNAFHSLSTSVNYNIISPDINGDGASDIIFIQNVPFAPQSYIAYYSIGDIFIEGFSTSGHFDYTTFDVLKYRPKYGTYVSSMESITVPTNYEYSVDFNGDGIFDLVSIDATNTNIITNNLLEKKTQYISRITSAIDKQFQITYANTRTLFDNTKTTIYDSYTPANLGSLVSVNPSKFVVRSTSVDNTNLINISTHKRYVYGPALFHKYGKGFLGFSSFSNFNSSTGLGSITSFTPSATYFIPEQTSTLSSYFSYSTYSGIGSYGYDYHKNSSFQKTDYTFTSLGGKKVFVAPNKLVNIDLLNSSAAETTIQYDLNQKGNITNSTVTYGWVWEPNIKTEQTDYTYQTAHGIIKPLLITTTSTQQGEPPYIRAKQFLFDNANGHLLSTTSDPTNISGLSLVTQYSDFNVFGSPTTANVSSLANDITQRTSYTFFDATGRFIIKTINPHGNVEEFVYESKYGNLIQKKNITGLISKYTYDALGRLIQTKLPDNTTNTIEYHWLQPSTAYTTYYKTVKNEGQAYQTTFYNYLGNQTATETIDVNGNTIVTENKYDYNTGVLTETSEPHFASQTGYLTTRYTYDFPYLRATKTEIFKTTGPSNYTSKGIFTQTTFNNPTPFFNYYYPSNATNYIPAFIEITDQTGKKLRKEFNAARQMTVTINSKSVSFPNFPNPADVQTSTYAYTSNGNPKSVVLSYDPSLNITNITHNFEYDDLGRQKKLIDPTSGIIKYTYNTIGQLIEQQEPNGTYDYTYDELGRVLTRTGSTSGVTNYQYVTGSAGKNKLQKIIGQNAITEFTYDYLSRPISRKETVQSTGKVFTTSTEYDTYSRVTKQTHTGGFITKYSYASTGDLLTIKDDNNQSLWQLNGQNALGQITDYTYGNGINTIKVYNDLHQLQEVNHGSIHKQQYNFDALTGNLMQRDFYNISSNTHNREKFQFDALDRLNLEQQTDPVANDAQIYANNTAFDILGNITHKQDAATGDFMFSNSAQPYNITQINNPTSLIPTNQLNTAFNDLRKISQISEPVSGKEMDFIYGNDDERLKVDYLVNGIKQYTKYYQANYDYQEDATGTNTKEYTYIYAPTGLLAVYYKQNTSGQLFYALTDHLGSPIMLTNNYQQIQEEYSFDAWGRRRNPVDWTYTVTMPNILNRGFTFHEHIDEFNLINMNGRLYDPALGRFIQPDNYVQSPDNIQNFNRYTYVYNNPLKHTDPSGEYEVVDDIAAMLLGGVSNLIANWETVTAQDGGWNQFFAGWEYFTAGAIGAEVGLYAGPAAGFAVAGALNVAADGYNKQFSDEKLDGKSPYLAVTESFVKGGLSSLAGDEAAAEVSDAKWGEAAGLHMDPSFKNFYEFTTNGSPLLKGVYYGVKNVARNFANDNYSRENQGDVGIHILTNFVGGFLGSLGSDLYEGYSKIDKLKGAQYFMGKLIPSYTIDILSNGVDGGLNNILHTNPYSAKIFGTNSSYYNSDFDFTPFPNEFRDNTPDITDVFILSIIKH